MLVVWTPSGDAAIALLARQSADFSLLGSGGDSSSIRTYYGTFRRNLARTSLGPDGERYGFSQPMVAVDTNTRITDDNEVHTLFAATSLIDGTRSYPQSQQDVIVSGSKGESAANQTPFLFFGWNYDDANADNRVEGVFVDLQDDDGDGDTLDLTSTTPTQITLPGIGTGEEVDATIRTSGRDMLFTATDTDGAGQDRLYLVRVDPAGPSLDAPVEISRGTNTGDPSTLTPLALWGDGFRALNGQDTTWVVFRDDEYEDGTVTQDDEDLLVAQIDAAGAVTLDEFDHNGVAAVNTNDLVSTTLQFKRGATRAFLYYTQTADADPAAEQNNDALYVRALRLDGSQALADNLSAEASVNTLNNSDGVTAPDFDANVTDVFVAPSDPFCGADANHDASYVAYIQELDNDTAGAGDDSTSLRARLVTIDDVTAASITISLDPEDVVFADVDDGWNVEVRVVPGSASTGEDVLFVLTNGNNLADDDATSAFDELRPFVYASALPNGQSITPPLQIGSDTAMGPGLSFPQFSSVETEGARRAIVTPNVAASRDFAFDDDLQAPDYALFVFAEFVDAPQTFNGGWYVARRMDLRDLANSGAATDRFEPPLTERPTVISADDDLDFDELDDDNKTLELLAQGNDVLAVFLLPTYIASNVHGRLFVNTLTNGSWSEAALLSNDDVADLGDADFLFGTSNEPNTVLIPGYDAACCPTAINAQSFWLRTIEAVDSSEESLRLQTRRIQSLALPR